MEQNEIKERLEEVIQIHVDYLKGLNPSSDEYANAADALNTLYKLKLEEDKLDMSYQEDVLKEKQIDIDKELKEKELDEQKKGRLIQLGLAVGNLALPLMFYNKWMKAGFKFETDGTFTSQTFKNLFSRFRPTGK